MIVERRLQRRFRKALRDYHLIEDGDKILVGLSGGKDSLCLLELLARQSKVYQPHFTIEALHVRMENIQYETDTTYLQRFCDTLGVPLHIITTSFEPSEKKPACFLCSWQRRKQLFNLAQELGCNKIALGHHQDDIIHTALMNLTFQGQFSTMPAYLEMEKMPLAIIRPLCLCEETDIKAYAEQQGYERQLKQCPYEHDTNRTAAYELLERMQQMNTEARYSIWNALEAGNKLIQRLTILLLLFVSTMVHAQQSERIQRMTEATQHIMFIDSVVVDKKNFLRAYHLTEEGGKIAPCHSFFPKDTSQTLTFMNALNNRCFYANQDTTKQAALIYREYQNGQWTNATEALGTNDFLQFQQIGYPFMMPDGITLYFAAKGEDSIGGYDIFMTTYDREEGRFLKPENIGMPFNSTDNDYMLAIDEYNQLGFFASDRNQPEGKVCVYTFVPAEKYQTYDAAQYTQEQIADFAQIARIAQTWDNKQQLNEAKQRLQKAKSMTPARQPAFSFVINDQLTYHHLSNFKAPDNQERYNQLVTLKQRYEQTVLTLEKARKYYSKATTNERMTLAREILDNEDVLYELSRAIHQKEKAIRQAENIYLTNNK